MVLQIANEEDSAAKETRPDSVVHCMLSSKPLKR